MANSNAKENPQAHDLRSELSGFSAHDQKVTTFLSSRPWMTYVIIGLNVLAFALMAALFQTVNGFNPLQLAAAGGNSAVLDLSGQWWRLLSYQFLHANILHIAINMWVFWSVGRFTERLYGNLTLLFLYLVSGIIAGLTSTVWNPEVVSVGASGSIFGILGAFLAFLLRFRNETPSSILRYWIPVFVFAGYNLFAGASQPGVDNAAHVGGVIAGFFLGLILAKEPGEPRMVIAVQATAALSFICVCILAPLWYLNAFDYRRSELEAFEETHRWYMDGEIKNLQLWQSLAVQIGSGSVSNDDAANSFEQNILPFWQQADARFQNELKQPHTDQNPFVLAVAKFAKVRSLWAQVLVSALRNNSQQDAEMAAEYAQQIVPIQSELDWLNLRDQAERTPTPLSQSALAIWIRKKLPQFGPDCIRPPAFMEKPLSTTDALNDGPAQRSAAGCEAQKMFLMGDYQNLDRVIKDDTRHLSNLPDGSSRLEGMWTGLDDLFSYSSTPVAEVMRRLAQWRKAVKDSAEPDLVEADMFRTWAYDARGHGFASSVSVQAMQVFSARSFMASASVRDAVRSSIQDPMWYVLVIALDRDESNPLQAQTFMFNLGASRFHGYLPLYRQILTSLMPRWGGSFQAVDDFIRSDSTKGGQIDSASYARSYLIYSDLEGDDFNVIERARADPNLIRQGMAMLRIRYPRSDYILNATARFACIDRDWNLYRSISAHLSGHISAQAWPGQLSFARCNSQSLGTALSN